MKIRAEKIVELEDLFPHEKYENRLSYIKDYKKEHLLKLFASINCFSNSSIKINYSEQEQKAIIHWLFSHTPTSLNCINILENLTGNRFFPTVFHRAANVIALEEILTEEISGKKNISELEDIENILKYYFSINSLFVKKQIFSEDQKLNLSEKFLSGISPSNELNLPFYPIEDVWRSQKFINSLIQNPTYGNYIKDYFDKLGIEGSFYAIWIIKVITIVQAAKTLKPPIFKPQKKEDIILFAHYSQLSIIKGVPPLETLNVKKSPIYKLEEGIYLLLDIPFLIDKCYHSLINDLWFDCLKINGVKRKQFMSDNGYFFENYIGEKFKATYSDWNNPPVKVTDDLLFKDGKQQLELADVYLRHFNKILVGQAKVSALKSLDKYTEEEEGLFNMDKLAFYSKFGLNQLVETTIPYLISSPQVVDEHFPKTKKIKIYPILIVQERLLLNVGINLAFQHYFRNLLKDKFTQNAKIPDNTTDDIIIEERFYVKPVVIMYIADIEIIQLHISAGEYDFWEIIENHIKETNLLVPFTETVNLFIGQPYKDFIDTEIKPLFKKLVN